MTLIAAARSVLEDAWDDERGYCFPHRNVYPHLWLWDSCFHAIAWAALGDERAVRELEAVFVGQLDDGFVPHMRYAEPTIDRGPLEHASSFTQPPVFAHAAAELSRRGLTVPEHLMAAATAGLEWLWRHRMGDDGLLYVVHPWESGADDSPRWDDWVGGSEWNRSEWTEADMRWRDAVTYHPSGAAAWSTEFVAAPAAFNAIAAHGAAELAGMTGDGDWQRRADALADAIDRELWDEEAGLWSDRAVVGGGPSVARPTLDGALPALVTADEARARSALARLGAPAEFRGEFGLRYVPATDPAYDPAGYWRGSAWMQLHYLCWLAAARWGDEDLLAFLPACSRAAAERAGFAEHWNPDTGEGLGARPQTWSALVVAMAPPQAADVFLSYASEDRDVATDVAAAIERRGWEVFWDTRLVAGEQYRDALAHHLATVGCVVVLWSEHSVASRWVRDEAGRGAERGVLVPARIAEVALPLGFGEAHTADLTRWDGDDGHPEMIELLSGVERTLTGTVAPPPELTHWQRLRRGLTWRKLRERLWRSLGAAAVVFGLLGFGLVQIVDWIRGPPPPRAMQGDVNVAVADFAVAEATDRELAAREGQSLAGSVHAQLVSSLGCDGVRFDCRPPTDTGRVDGDAAAEELSNDILADIVVFGTVTEARGRVTFTPVLHLGDRHLLRAEELAGPHPLAPQTGDVTLIAQREALRAQVEAQAANVADLARALSFYASGDFASALALVEEIIESGSWELDVELLHLIAGNLHGKLGDAAAAEAAYRRALDLRAGYARGLLGLAEATFQASTGADGACAAGSVDLAGVREAIGIYEQAPLAPVAPAAANIDLKAAFGVARARVCLTQAGVEDGFAGADALLSTVIAAHDETGDRGLDELAAESHALRGFVAL